MTFLSPPRASENRASRDRADYGFARLRDQVFDAVTALWRRRKAEGLSQKELADQIGRDPAWVSRSLAAPGNWTLRTAGELIQALQGEAEIHVAALEDPLETPSNYDAYAGYLVENAPSQMVGINLPIQQLPSSTGRIPAPIQTFFRNPLTQVQIGAA